MATKNNNDADGYKEGHKVTSVAKMMEILGFGKSSSKQAATKAENVLANFPKRPMLSQQQPEKTGKAVDVLKAREMQEFADTAVHSIHKVAETVKLAAARNANYNQHSQAIDSFASEFEHLAEQVIQLAPGPGRGIVPKGSADKATP